MVAAKELESVLLPVPPVVVTMVAAAVMGLDAPTAVATLKIKLLVTARAAAVLLPHEWRVMEI